MNNKKTGISMCGSIEHTRSDKTKKFIRKVDNIKTKNAKVCLNCESNKEGFCDKYKGWCSKVNYRCNGYTMSYQERLQQNKYEHELKQIRDKKKRLEQKKKKNKAKRNAKARARKKAKKTNSVRISL